EVPVPVLYLRRDEKLGRRPSPEKCRKVNSAMSSNAPETAAHRLADIRQRIERAAARVDGKRSADLVAVSKTFDSEAITPLIEAGQRHFGENRVQGAQGKWPPLKAAHLDIVLHL